MHVEGVGGIQDEVKAATLFRKACDAGHIRGCGNLALALFDGRGVSQDRAHAARLDEHPWPLQALETYSGKDRYEADREK